MGKKIMIFVVLAAALLLAVSCGSNPSGANSYTPAPTFTLSDITGHQISLADYKGDKAVLLVFMSCTSDGIQDPVTQGYLSQYKNNPKLETFCVADGAAMSASMSQMMSGQAGSTDSCPMAQFMSGQGTSTLPMMDVDGTVSQAYQAAPDKTTLVLIDQQGQIRLHQEMTATAEANTELAQLVEKVTK